MVVVASAVAQGNIHHYRNKIGWQNGTFPKRHQINKVRLGKQTEIHIGILVKAFKGIKKTCTFFLIIFIICDNAKLPRFLIGNKFKLIVLT